jgi:hypothetical protein
MDNFAGLAFAAFDVGGRDVCGWRGRSIPIREELGRLFKTWPSIWECDVKAEGICE